MNELINEILKELLENGQIKESFARQVECVTDSEGNVTITYKNPKNLDDYKEIKNFIDDLDDDMFMEATEAMNEINHSAYIVLAKQLDNLTDVMALKESFKLFKKCVKNVAEKRIDALQKLILDLHRKYVKED